MFTVHLMESFNTLLDYCKFKRDKILNPTNFVDVLFGMCKCKVDNVEVVNRSLENFNVEMYKNAIKKGSLLF